MEVLERFLLEWLGILGLKVFANSKIVSRFCSWLLQFGDVKPFVLDKSL